MWRRLALSAVSSASLLTALFTAAFLAVEAGLVGRHERESLALLLVGSVAAIVASGWGRTSELLAAGLVGPPLAYGSAAVVDAWLVRPLDLSPRVVAGTLVAVGVVGFVSSARAKRRTWATASGDPSGSRAR